MKYACLVYIDPSVMGVLSADEGAKLTDDSINFDWDLERRGQLIMAQPLDAPKTAITVRVREGKLSTIDGPYAETKEFLGGFFLIEAGDIGEAVRLAQTSPMARMGSIEVRPFLTQIHSETGAGRPRA